MATVDADAAAEAAGVGIAPSFSESSLIMSAETALDSTVSFTSSSAAEHKAEVEAARSLSVQDDNIQAFLEKHAVEV